MKISDECVCVCVCVCGGRGGGRENEVQCVRGEGREGK